MRGSITAVELIQEIDNAFSDVQYPGDDSIVVRPTDWEASGIRADFLGKHWRDVIHPDFLRAHNLFCFFSVEGFWFYLPAYLIGLVRFPDEGVDWSNQVLSALYPTARYGNAWLPRWAPRMKAMSSSQKRAVRLTLEYMLETQPDCWRTIEAPGNELKLALMNYWSQF
jgi:hypothetical protein